MKTFTRRAALLGTGALIGGYLTHRYSAANPTLAGTRSLKPTGTGRTLNDASGLSQTPIFRHITRTDDPDDALIAALRVEIAEARTAGRPVALSAARQVHENDPTALAPIADFFGVDVEARLNDDALIEDLIYQSY